MLLIDIVESLHMINTVFIRRYNSNVKFYQKRINKVKLKVPPLKPLPVPLALVLDDPNPLLVLVSLVCCGLLCPNRPPDCCEVDEDLPNNPPLVLVVLDVEFPKNPPEPLLVSLLAPNKPPEEEVADTPKSPPVDADEVVDVPKRPPVDEVEVV